MSHHNATDQRICTCYSFVGHGTGRRRRRRRSGGPPGVAHQFAGRSPLVVTVQAKKEKRSVDAITPSTTASSARMPISHPEQKVCVTGTRCAEKEGASCNIARDLLAHSPRPNQWQILGFRRASAWDQVIVSAPIFLIIFALRPSNHALLHRDRSHHIYASTLVVFAEFPGCPGT